MRNETTSSSPSLVWRVRRFVQKPSWLVSWLVSSVNGELCNRSRVHVVLSSYITIESHFAVELNLFAEG